MKSLFSFKAATPYFFFIHWKSEENVDPVRPLILFVVGSWKANPAQGRRVWWVRVASGGCPVPWRAPTECPTLGFTGLSLPSSSASTRTIRVLAVVHWHRQ